MSTPFQCAGNSWTDVTGRTDRPDRGIEEGKLAVVIGASNGTGRAVAVELALAGCEVVAVGRNVDRLRSLEEGLRERLQPRCCIPLAADMMDRKAAEGVTAAILERGAPQIVVHAIGGSMGLKDSSLPSEDWAKVWRLNLGIAVDLNNALVPGMVSKGWGRIVHFSSNATKLAIGNTPYASAKAAVEGYVKGFSKEVSAKGVIVTAIRPGPINNGHGWMYQQEDDWRKRFMADYLPIGRWGDMQNAARVVKFLCSQDAEYMPGAIVDVDGGMR